MSEPLRPVDAARILARAAAVDNRKPDAAADEVWCSALNRAGLTFADFRDCLEAVDAHYGSTADRLMPVHIIKIVTQVRRDRVKREQTERALAAADRDDVLPPGELHRRIAEARDAARAAKHARQAAEPARTDPLDGGWNWDFQRTTDGGRYDGPERPRRTADGVCRCSYIAFPHALTDGCVSQ